MVGISYGEILFISDKKPKSLPVGISFQKIPRLKNINDYSKFIVYDLAGYIKTNYALVVQYGGYVLRPEKWSDKFLSYDYIGAP